MWCMKISIQFVVSTYMHALYTQEYVQSMLLAVSLLLYLTKTKKTKKLKKIQ